MVALKILRLLFRLETVDLQIITMVWISQCLCFIILCEILPIRNNIISFLKHILFKLKKKQREITIIEV